MSHKHLFSLVLALAAAFTTPANAQKLFTRDGVVGFDATAPNSPESIKAVNFSLALADYNVDIPALVADKISKMASINIAANLSPMK